MDKSDNVNMLKILFEEEDDNDVLLWYLSWKTESESYHEILVNGHLKNNEKKCREFFRINRNRFDFILNSIRDLFWGL